MTPFPVWTSALLLALSILGWPQATHAQDVIAQDVIRACYNPAGVLYVIGVPGQPDECRGDHTEISWLSGSQASGVSFSTGSSPETAPGLPPEDLLSTSFTTSEAGPAIVWFYAELSQGSVTSPDNPADHFANFELYVDGEEIVRNRHGFEIDKPEANMIGFSWPLELEAGPHTVTVKWYGNNNPRVRDRSLIVRYVE